MDALFDTVTLARIQFALVVAYHFLFVPLSIGVGLIMALNATRAYRSNTPGDEASSRFWVKLFTATFALGVATGITMEFSFGMNWADYSRFVGDIFGAPLAAEALLAFFLESVFLGVLIFGREKVGRRAYLASAWLVFFGSCLSALWILIANSWMQTPAGAELSSDGTRAVLTDFLAAAFNPSTLPRYFHTVLALLVMGAFSSIAIAGWYRLKGRHTEFARKTLRTGVIVACIATCALMVSAHSSAVVVAEEQPTKIAMMEGHYDEGTLPMFAFGWVDEADGDVVTPFELPGFTSFLASGDFDATYPGLNDLAAENADIDVNELPVQAVFQSYHLMVALAGAIVVVLVLAAIAAFKKDSRLGERRWLQRLLVVCPVFPLLAIMAGWFTAELGRQPYVVYPATSSPEGIELLTSEAYSSSVSAPELLVTIVIFTAVYVLLIVGWARIVGRLIAAGPTVAGAGAPQAAPAPQAASQPQAATRPDAGSAQKQER